jgi:hypothetical protein
MFMAEAVVGVLGFMKSASPLAVWLHYCKIDKMAIRVIVGVVVGGVS